MVDKHIQKRELHELVIIPKHEKRKESKEFKLSKKRLKEDSHYKCWVCGSTENLQVHHIFAEWCLQDDVDYEKLKQMCEEWDVYGYGRLLKHISITSADDIRNTMVLCQEHHTGGMTDGISNGIHNITFPIWIIQKIKKDNANPVPDDTKELSEELDGGK